MNLSTPGCTADIVRIPYMDVITLTVDRYYHAFKSGVVEAVPNSQFYPNRANRLKRRPASMSQNPCLKHGVLYRAR